MNDMPRWTDPARLTPLERLVHAAFVAVEDAGAHPLLTDASGALQGALKSLVEWHDICEPGHNEHAAPLPKSGAVNITAPLGGRTPEQLTAEAYGRIVVKGVEAMEAMEGSVICGVLAVDQLVSVPGLRDMVIRVERPV